MIDLATYTPMGDKKNSDFFEEYLPRVYERRQESGLDQIVGNMAALVVQVEHGDGVDYMAELAAMGPVPVPVGAAHRHAQGLRPAVAAGVPAADRARAADARPTRTTITRWNMLYPLAAQEAERPLHRRGLPGRSRPRRCARRWSRRTSASPTRATR